MFVWISSKFFLVFFLVWWLAFLHFSYVWMSILVRVMMGLEKGTLTGWDRSWLYITVNTPLHKVLTGDERMKEWHLSTGYFFLLPNYVQFQLSSGNSTFICKMSGFAQQERFQLFPEDESMSDKQEPSANMWLWVILRFSAQMFGEGWIIFEAEG